MGFVAKNFTILAGTRFALGGIDDQIMGPFGSFLGHERPFHAGRKTRAAAPAQFRFLDFLDNFFAALCHDGLGPRPIPPFFGGLEAGVPETINIGENTVFIVEHGYFPAP